jgi:uncharacterized delta-60 repeat protein
MHPAIHAVTTIGLFATAASIGAAQLPIPDPAYGGSGDGIARIAVAGVPADNGYATHAVVQADGGLVMVGSTSTTSGQQTVRQVVLARSDAQGLPDTGFGPEHDGFYRSAFDGTADDIAQTVDGSLVYAGDSNLETMIVGRLHADGTPDTGFFLSGHRLILPSALVDGAVSGVFKTILPLPNGKTLALGTVIAPPEPGQYFSCAMRLLADGSTDIGFGTAGRTCIAPTPSPGALSLALVGRVLADGRILLAGGSQHSGGSGYDMSVARLGADGALDTSFGPSHDGWAFVGFDQGGTLEDAVAALAVDDAGRLLLAGYFRNVNGLNDIGLARLLPDGQPDTSFGSQGRVQIDLGVFRDEITHSISALADGGILVGAVAFTNGGSPVSIAILLKSDGQFDPRFGESGVFLQADPAAPPTAQLESKQQILAGDYLYMVGSAINASNQAGFGATRTVMPLFADSFEDPEISRSAQP